MTQSPTITEAPWYHGVKWCKAEEDGETKFSYRIVDPVDGEVVAFAELFCADFIVSAPETATERDRLRTELSTALSRIAEWEEIARARLALIERQQPKLEEYRARIAELEGALEPFARCYNENWQRDADDQTGIVTYQTDGEEPELILGDLKMASTILSKGKTDV